MHRNTLQHFQVWQVPRLPVPASAQPSIVELVVITFPPSHLIFEARNALSHKLEVRDSVRLCLMAV